MLMSSIFRNTHCMLKVHSVREASNLAAATAKFQSLDPTYKQPPHIQNDQVTYFVQGFLR